MFVDVAGEILGRPERHDRGRGVKRPAFVFAWFSVCSFSIRSESYRLFPLITVVPLVCGLLVLVRE